MAFFLVRYAEIGLKSERVRKRFVRILAENIEDMFLKEGVECLITWDRGRVFLVSQNEEKAARILSHTFGVTSFSPVTECSAEREEIAEKSAALASSLLREGCTFAVRARRSGGQPFTSIELAAYVGEKILSIHEGQGIRVDLENPEVEIFIEARAKSAFIFTSILQGPGGLPLGSQGNVLSIVRERKDMVAAWMMMRRGCRVTILTRGDADVSGLKQWDPGLQIISSENISDAAGAGFSGISFPRYSNEDLELYRRLRQMGKALFFPADALSCEEMEMLLKKIIE